MTSSPSYIDYETFLDPSFSPTSFAQTLVTTTNNPSDTPLDLSTPLSRVLFDIQEVDSHVHTLTTKSALPLLRYTTDTTASGQRVLLALEAQVLALTEGYQRLEKDVVRRWELAEEVRGAAERSWATVKLARAVSRCLMLGRQLEGQLVEISGREREDHRALVRASQTLLMFRRMFADNINDGEEEGYGVGLDRVRVVRTLRADLVNPAENSVKARAQQIVSRFSLPTDEQGRQSGGGTGSTSSTTYAQQEEARARLISAMTALYLLSPTPQTQTHTQSATANFQPELLLVTLKSFIHSSLTASLQALVRGLSQLPSLERALLEVSNRCQTLVVLEKILQGARQPVHPFYNHATSESSSSSTTTTMTLKEKEKNARNNLLYPLLQYLDTSSLPSYFWRCLASALSPRVGELLNRGGAAARALRGNRERLRDEIRQCVLRGSSSTTASRDRDRGRDDDGGGGGGGEGLVVGNWEREAAVMVGAVLGGR